MTQGSDIHSAIGQALNSGDAALRRRVLRDARRRVRDLRETEMAEADRLTRALVPLQAVVDMERALGADIEATMDAVEAGDPAAEAAFLDATRRFGGALGAETAGDAAGWAPLHQAILQGDAGPVEALLRAGADPNAVFTAFSGAPDLRGATPLHAALFAPDIVRLLLEHGADATRVDRHGQTARAKADALLTALPRSRAADRAALEETRRLLTEARDAPDIP